MKKIRLPAVAGRFYPADAEELRVAVDSYTSGGSATKRVARACIVPHAGYMYSGGVAGGVYQALEIPKRIILIGPRHYPRGEALAILSEGAWRTPLGDAQMDHALATEILRAFPALREDEVAHSMEHALEVQLPFLQRLAGDFQFVPIAVGTDRLDVLESLGRAMATVIAGHAEPILIVTSSDMNHYESDAITRVKDGYAIEKILALDARGLYETVRGKKISMCGMAAAVAMLTAVRELGATKAELIAYATSSDVSGDMEYAVGYAGVVVD